MNHDQTLAAIDSKVEDILRSKLAAVAAERDHWKANHDNRVRAAKLLTERTDMPMERIGAYKHYVAALEENQKLRELAESAESELLAVRKDNHSMILEIHNLQIERDALAATAPSVPDVPGEWREVMAELAADLQAACDAEHPHRDQYPSVMRKYNNDMEIVEKARALLQSAEVKS